MTLRQKIKAIEGTGILPSSYFPSDYYPRTFSTENPELLIEQFRETADRWLEWYPQDAGTPFYANLQSVRASL